MHELVILRKPHLQSPQKIKAVKKPRCQRSELVVLQIPAEDDGSREVRRSALALIGVLEMAASTYLPYGAYNADCTMDVSVARIQ